MKLGAFSISLSVKNLQASKAFYEKLGFSVFAGDEDKNYLIMKNQDSLIGLFQGMFEDNIITFNPGWDANVKKLENFDDIRVIESSLKTNGIKLEKETATKSGADSIVLKDPDGNVILIDQHVG